MPRNASASRKSRKISKSKIRQNTTSVGQTLATSENNQESCVQKNKQDSLEHNNLWFEPRMLGTVLPEISRKMSWFSKICYNLR